MKLLRLGIAFIRDEKMVYGLMALLFCLASFVFGVLGALNHSMYGEGDNPRIITTHEKGMTEFLPYTHIDRIRDIDGVKNVGHHTWFGGYQDIKNPYLMFAVDAEVWVNQRPALNIEASQKQDFFATKNGLLLTSALAEKHGWKIGDTVSMRSIIYNREQVWDFKISGFFDSTEDEQGRNYMVFHYNYLNDSRVYLMDMVGSLVIGVDEDALVGEVARRIDDAFKYETFRTRSLSDKQFHEEFFDQFGNLSFLIKATSIASLFSVALIFVSTIFLLYERNRKNFAVLRICGYRVYELCIVICFCVLLVLLTGAAGGFALGELLNRYVAQYLPQNLPQLKFGWLFVQWQIYCIIAISVLSVLLPIITVHHESLREVLGRNE